MKELCCCVTAPFNDTFNLRLWCNYYGRQVGHNHLYVLMANPFETIFTELHSQFPQIHFIPTPEPTFPPGTYAGVEQWRCALVHQFQTRALQHYQTTIFSDPDEILIPTSGSLQQFVSIFASSHYQWLRAVGYNVVQQVDREPPVVRSAGVDTLNDRNTCFRHPVSYDKTLISKVALKYDPGMHSFWIDGVKQINEPLCTDLALVHLNRLDVDAWMQQCAPRFNDPGQHDRQRHRRVTIDDAVQFFKTHAALWTEHGLPMHDDTPLTIPDHWRGQIYYA